MPRRPIRSPFCARHTASSLALALLLAACAGPTADSLPAKAPDASAAPRFGLMGDAPYSDAEVRRLDALIGAMNQEPLAFVAHVGDITSGRGPCSDEWFEAR